MTDLSLTILPLNEFFCVCNEFRVSVSPEFVQIDSLPFSFEAHTKWQEPVQEAVQSVGGWEDKSDQSRDAYHLCDELPRVAA